MKSLESCGQGTDQSNAQKCITMGYQRCEQYVLITSLHIFTTHPNLGCGIHCGLKWLHLVLTLTSPSLPFPSPSLCLLHSLHNSPYLPSLMDSQTFPFSSRIGKIYLQTTCTFSKLIRDTEHPFSPLSPLSLPTLSPGWCPGGVMHLMTFTHFTIPYYFCGLTKFCSFFPNYRGLPLALSGCWFPGSDLSEVANQIPWKLWCHRACGGELGDPEQFILPRSPVNIRGQGGEGGPSHAHFGPCRSA